MAPCMGRLRLSPCGPRTTTSCKSQCLQGPCESKFLLPPAPHPTPPPSPEWSAQGCPRGRAGIGRAPGVPTQRVLSGLSPPVPCPPFWPEWGSQLLGAASAYHHPEGGAGSSDLSGSALRPLKAPFRFPTCPLLPRQPHQESPTSRPRRQLALARPCLRARITSASPRPQAQLSHLLATGVVWLVRKPIPPTQGKCR